MISNTIPHFYKPPITLPTFLTPPKTTPIRTLAGILCLLEFNEFLCSCDFGRVFFLWPLFLFLSFGWLGLIPLWAIPYGRLGWLGLRSDNRNRDRPLISPSAIMMMTWMNLEGMELDGMGLLRRRVVTEGREEGRR